MEALTRTQDRATAPGYLQTEEPSSVVHASSGAGSTSASISANDFLTLLVTEMQNQDPTANTDPNQYINQLVQVNSLEQLISINQTLGDALGSTGGTVGGGSGKAHAAGVPSSDSSPIASQQDTPSSIVASLSEFTGLAAREAPGNLSIPVPSAAAQHVAQSLSGQRPASRTSASLTRLR